MGGIYPNTNAVSFSDFLNEFTQAIKDPKATVIEMIEMGSDRNGVRVQFMTCVDEWS